MRILERLAIHPWLIVGVTCAGAFIGQLDASIVQLALPALAQGFDVKVDSVRWVAIAYLLAFACSLAVSGRVSEMMGRKLPYLLALRCSPWPRCCAAGRRRWSSWWRCGRFRAWAVGFWAPTA